ncbi:MAG: hypothetical protein KAW45_07585 [Thermoplasmatales archaeon]|nr:hypothetical protein [Thermoplasmatales archaeon]
MKTKIISLLVITLLIASTVLSVAGTMNGNRITAWENLEYTTGQADDGEVEDYEITIEEERIPHYLFPNNIRAGILQRTINYDYCECGEKPSALMMQYTGEDCSATNHSQDPEKVSCSGDPMFASPVHIIATDKSNPDDPKAKIWFNGSVLLNETFNISAVNAGETKLKSNTHAFIYNTTDGTLLQYIKFHTSCSQPLFYGDQFGSLKLIGFSPDCHNYPPEFSGENPEDGITGVSVTISELSLTIEDPDGDSFNWSITTSPNIGSNSGTGENNGTKTCSVSGLEYDTTYTWYVTASDPDGSGETTVETYTFTTMSNDPPVIYNPNPANGATNIPITITELSVTIEDPEGDTIDWTITTSPDIGSSSGTGESGGTKTCSVSGLQYDTTYTWVVTASDPDGSGETTVETYTFTTMSNDPPVISNPDPSNGATGVSVTISELSVTIEDPDGDPIDWTITTSPDIGSSSGTGESGGTKTCSVSGLQYDTTYTWVVTASDSGGRRETTEKTYTFTTINNYPPIIFNPDPEDGLTGVSIYGFELSVTIEDPEGDLFDWTITTSPDVGSNSGTGESNGTKTCDVYCGLEYNTTYTWYVEATDPDGSGETSEEVYTFTTELEGNNPPVISNPYPKNGATGIPITISELSVTIEDPEGDLFDWTITTSPDIGSSSGTGESSGTKTCGISGLEYETIYRWKVEATDPDGSGITKQRICTFTTESEPLTTPSIPDGPQYLDIGESGEYCTSTKNSDKAKFQYRFDWDAEGSHDYSYWSDFVSSGTEVCMEKSWSKQGRYVVKAQARDELGTTSYWSDGLTVAVGNQPPNTPTINGPTSGKPGTSYDYEFTSADSDGDQVSYYVEWGDGSVTDWTAFQASGPPGYSESHKWDEQGTYTIEAKAMDQYGAESGWGTLTVTMPRNRLLSNTFFMRLLELFPNAFPILRYILGL